MEKIANHIYYNDCRCNICNDIRIKLVVELQKENAELKNKVSRRNMQIKDLEKKIKFIEIKPRFGGAAPLSIKAGANFPKWILQELRGEKPGIRFDGFKDGLIMLRYDGEVWIDGSARIGDKR